MKSNIFKKAHELTKNIIKKGDNYRATFSICLSFVYSQIKKGVAKMVELKGTEKQVKWATDIRKEVLEVVKTVRKEQINKASKKETKIKKDGTIITAQDRINKINKRFDTIVEVLSSNENSVFFIENFKDITSDDYDVFRKRTVREGIEELYELNKFAMYFQ